MESAMFNFVDGIKEVKIGDTFISYNYHNGYKRKHTIKKIGRELIHTDTDSFYIKTGLQKTDYTPCKAYTSIEVLESINKQNIFIERVRNDLKYRTLNYSQALSIARILGIKYDC